METVKKVITIPSNLKKVFEEYLYLTKPLHGLRPLEIRVIAVFLYYNVLEMENFKREEDRWVKLFSYETKLKIRNDLKIKDHTLQNLLSSLRKKGVIVDNKIAPYYVPQVQTKTKSFQLIYNFNIKDEQEEQGKGT
tara:strand:+ start:1477 stop:1884 length:408 start_codon:yes stop_codon:yes gene_type:complete